MSNYNWSRFVKRININADIEIIYNAIATRAGLETWFLRKAEFKKADNTLRPANSHIQKGDNYEWLWYGYPDNAIEKQTVLGANGKDFIQFVFSGNCTVSIKIKTEENETIVELTQENIPPDENPKTNLYIACGEGWTFYLANLKVITQS